MSIYSVVIRNLIQYIVVLYDIIHPQKIFLKKFFGNYCQFCQLMVVLIRKTKSYGGN